MANVIDFRPSVGLSQRFARDSWSVWYSSMFTVPNSCGGVDVLDRPALQVFISLMPFAVRRIVSPDDERVQSVVADRFQGWLVGYCASARVSDLHEGCPPGDRLLVEDRGRFAGDALSHMVLSYGYVQEDLHRPAVVKLFSALCQEFVEWLADKPEQAQEVWTDRIEGFRLFLNPSGQVYVCLGRWRSRDPWATDREVPVTVTPGDDPREE